MALAEQPQFEHPPAEFINPADYPRTLAEHLAGIPERCHPCLEVLGFVCQSVEVLGLHPERTEPSETQVQVSAGLLRHVDRLVNNCSDGPVPTLKERRFKLVLEHDCGSTKSKDRRSGDTFLPES